MPNTMNISGNAAKALAAMFREYAAANKRDLPKLLKKQGAEASTNLFLLTPVGDAEEIELKLNSLGSRFIRAPRDYAMRVGPQFDAIAVPVGRKGKFKNKRRLSLNPWSLTLDQERYAALQLRKGRLGALKASWIRAVRLLGGKINVSKSEARKALKPMSEALFYGGVGAQIAVEIINYQAGIAKKNTDTGFVDSAIYKTIDNMRAYVIRKNQEKAAKFRKAALSTR